MGYLGSREASRWFIDSGVDLNFMMHWIGSLDSDLSN